MGAWSGAASLNGERDDRQLEVERVFLVRREAGLCAKGLGRNEAQEGALWAINCVQTEGTDEPDELKKTCIPVILVIHCVRRKT